MQLKNILTTLLIAFGCCSVSIAQQSTVSGTVKDAATHETLNGVTVSFGNNNGTVTDEDGKYDISMDAGEYTIEFSYLGYEKQNRHLNLKSGAPLTLNIELNQISNELNLVVVTASKYEKDITKETVSMEVLKPGFLTNSNTIDLDEAIQKVPGMTVIDNQANVRGGSGFSYGAGSRVLVLVDGIPELTGDAGDVKWEFLPIEIVEQVEIIKGASSVLYGSSALNGVINLRTRYPTAEPETHITAFQGLYQNPKDKGKVWWGNQQPYFGGGNFMHSRKFGQFDLVLGGNINNDQSFHEGQYNLRGRVNANTRYRFKKIDGLSTGLNINYMYYHSGTYFLWADDTTGAYRALGGLDSATTTVSEGKNTRMTIDPFVTYFSKKGDQHDLKFRYFYTKNNNNTDQGSISNYYYGEYQYHKHFTFDMNLVAGTSASYSGVNAELYGDHSATNTALFAQLDKTFGKLIVVAGVRFETFRVDTAKGNSNPVFRAGLNYELSKTTFLRASFGQGYRFPSIAEKFVNTSVGALKVFPNPDVQPEHGWSSELGIKQSFKINNWLGYLDLAGFMQRYYNLIEFKFGYYHPNPVMGEYDLNYLGFESVNIENARITGLEFSMVGQGSFFGVNTNVLAGITYINPINVDQKIYVDSVISNDQTLLPETIDSLEQTTILNYRFKTTIKFNLDQSYKKFSWGIEARYNSFMINIDPFFEGNDPLILYLFGEPVEFIPGVKSWRENHHHGDCVVDLRLSYNITDKIRVSFITKNSFNREYAIRPALMEAPRSYTAQVTVRM
ncbi:MAG: TonB-dependent receptor [Chitinophagaceae bacterium]|nr:TonB-dependent receptor [Chitinophagaceae bacterium]